MSWASAPAGSDRHEMRRKPLPPRMPAEVAKLRPFRLHWRKRPRTLRTNPRTGDEAIAAGTTGNAGDGGLALTLAGLRDTAMIALGDQSFHAYYSGNIGRLGTNVSFYESAESTEAAVAAQIANQMASVSGVSLDDEMEDMIRFQRSYQAAARALMVFDQVTEDLINMLRR